VTALDEVLDRYRAHTAFTDPGAHAALLRTLPADPDALAAAVRGLVVHYVASGLTFAPDRLAEIDSRWVERMLDRLAVHDASPLTSPRPVEACLVGCCRDFTLLHVAALREHGVPARSRVGFAPYLRPDFTHDHVVAERWDAGRGAWVRVDPQLDPAGWADVDVSDLGTGPGSAFRTASRLWLDHRAGLLTAADLDGYGVGPGSPVRGRWFVRNYVVVELAHLTGHELLLWDLWGAMTRPAVGQDGELVKVDPPDDPDLDALVDRVARLLLDPDAHLDALDALAADPRLDPRGGVVCASPRGVREVVDLAPAGGRLRATRAPGRRGPGSRGAPGP
jgi:hypothetical protein